MSCRAVQELLPEYVAGRPVPDRERIAGHLSRCESCDAARREIEAVFALLAQAPEAPPSLYGEANTRLALQSEFAAGPLRAERERKRREDMLFRICAAAAAFGTASFGAGTAFFWKSPGLGARMSGWEDFGLVRWMRNAHLLDPLWSGIALAVLLMGGIAAVLPALLQPQRPAGPGRRARREV